MKVTKGFTLVELVVVIVILGVLAATIAPKFINLSSDAKTEVIRTVAASIRAAADQTKIKAEIYQVADAPRSSPNNPPFIEVPQGVLELKYGYPEARPEETNSVGIVDLLTLSEDFEICNSTSSGDSCNLGSSSRVKIGYDTTENTGCYVRYSEPGGTGAPSDFEYGILIVDEGC